MATKESKIGRLRAERTQLETTDAIRLQQELLKATCESCGQKPKVTCTRGEVRYVKCGCGRKGKAVVERGILRWLESLTDEEFEALTAAPAEDEGAPEEEGAAAKGD